MASLILGHTEPRLFTPPLRPLTPETSRGFRANEWICNTLGFQLLPHQQWLNIHLLEINPDGSYVYETALILQGRQSGKTTWCAAFLLWRMIDDDSPAVLGAAQDRSIAFEAMERAHGMLLTSESPEIKKLIVQDRSYGLYSGNGKENLKLVGRRLKWEIAAAGRYAGRGKSPQTLLIDELRTMEDALSGGMASLEPITSAQPRPFNIYLSNAGEDRSAVLNTMEDGIRLQLELGEQPTTFYASWSAPDNSEITDRAAWAHALPTLNRITPEERIATKLSDPQLFKTEYLNIRVPSLTPSLIDQETWASLADTITLQQHAESLALFVDVSLELDHVTATAAAPIGDGRFRLQVVGEWTSTALALKALPALYKALKPSSAGWFNDGPTKALATDLASLGFEPVATSSEACAGLVESITSRRLLHTDDGGMLDSHIRNVAKLPSSEGFKFSRKHSTGPIDGAYSCAGALHLARNIKKKPKKSMVLPDMSMVRTAF